jgi:SCY1-like protein 1
VSQPTPTTSFDDKGEPDFAGWLAAQNQTKKAVTKPLPKGLAKSSTAPAAKRPIVAGRSSTTGSTARKVVVPPKQEVKKEQPKAKEDEVEGWGDDW